MRFNRVLLITAPVRAELEPVRPPIGLGYLAQTLAANGIAYDVLDLALGYSHSDLKEKIHTFRPTLVGMSIFSSQYRTAYRYLTQLKAHYPTLAIAAGGPHVSCLRAQALNDCPAIDFGVFLEGEQALLELCLGQRLDAIPNLIYRCDGHVLVNRAEFVADLDSIPFPQYQEFELPKYIPEISLVSSRGCPYSCTYCAVKRVAGRAVRLRSASKVVDEIEWWYQRGRRQFSFQDDNFNQSEERVYQICDEIQSRRLNDLLLRCAGARADRLSGGVLRRMRGVGFKTIGIGVEVGNDRLLGVIKKGEKFEDIDRAVRQACELGFDVYLSFLAGVPGETAADTEDAVTFARKYPVFYAHWCNIIPYPGTEMFEWLKERGYLLRQPEEYLNDASTRSGEPAFETPELGREERKRMLRRLRGVTRGIVRRAMTRRLREGRVPWGVAHVVGYVCSRETSVRFLFQRRPRRLADKARFWLYTRRGGRGLEASGR